MGTVAHIVSASPFADGRWALLTVGTRRFAVERWLPRRPYPRAEVHDMADGPVPGDEARLEEATAAVRRARTLLSELGSPAPVADLGAGDGSGTACRGPPVAAVHHGPAHARSTDSASSRSSTTATG